jgi:hypothetical protein
MMSWTLPEVGVTSMIALLMDMAASAAVGAATSAARAQDLIVRTYMQAS